MGSFSDIAAEVGKLVEEKNAAYGDSFAKSSEILRVLYPSGVEPASYGDLLCVVRVLDKLFRVATAKDAFGESPWRDVCGYAILALARADKGRGGKATTSPVGESRPTRMCKECRGYTPGEAPRATEAEPGIECGTCEYLGGVGANSEYATVCPKFTPKEAPNV